MSKGSQPRPFEVDHETYRNNYDRIFGRNPQRQEPNPDKQEKPALDPEKIKRTK